MSADLFPRAPWVDLESDLTSDGEPDRAHCQATVRGQPCPDEAIDAGRCLRHLPRRRRAALVRIAQAFARDVLARRPMLTAADLDVLRLANDALLADIRRRDQPRIDALLNDARKAMHDGDNWPANEGP